MSSVAAGEGAERGRLSVLWSITRPHSSKLLLGLVLGLFASLAGLASPMVTKWVLDTLTVGGSLLWPIMLLLGLLIVDTAISIVQAILLGTLGERIVLDARLLIIRRLFGARLDSVTSRSPGEVVARVTSDATLLREAASSSFIGLINGGIMVIGTLILMAVLDVYLLVVTVIAIVIVAVIFGALIPRLSKAEERAQEQVGALGALVESSVRAIRTVKANVAEDRQSNLIGAAATQSARYGVQAVRIEAAAWTVSSTGIQLAIIGILGFGAWRVSQGELLVSSLVAFLLYAFGLIGPISSLSADVTALQSGIVAAGRIREIQQLPKEPEPVEPSAPANNLPGGPSAGHEQSLVSLRHVSFAYRPERPVLRGINLDLPTSGQVAVVGPSGAGKTTLVSLLLRFVDPDAGELRWQGRPYRELAQAQLRANMAYVEQETPVLPGTIRDNVLFGRPTATDGEVLEALNQVRLLELITGLPDGLDTVVLGSQLSGGQRQRIALARGILGSPRLLILDEATAQTDAITEAAITATVAELARERLVLTIAHRLSTVVDADRIIVLQDGQIRAEGAHTELMGTDELYRDLLAALRITSAPSTSTR